MHDTAFRIGTLAMNIYADLKTASVLEIGSQVVNGSLRENALPTTRYVGLDLEAGDGVDVVVKAGEPLPVEDEAFDLVIASSVFEHDPAFWMTFLEMCRKAKEGGYIYINAPSNGMIHRYPQDNWRFYPDSAKALLQWAVSQGQNISLVESFTADRDNDIWNDFVAVFRKGRITKALPNVFLYENVACSNVITWKSSEIINRRDPTEDMLILDQARNRAQSAELAMTEAVQRCDKLSQELTKSNEGQAILEGRLKIAVEELERERLAASELGEQVRKAEQLAERERANRSSAEEYANLELVRVRDELAFRMSELRQREEEIEQTRLELAQVRSEHNECAANAAKAEERLDQMGRKLAEADSWAFELAGQRKSAERRADNAEQRLQQHAASKKQAEINAAHWKELYERQLGQIAQLRAAFEDATAHLEEQHAEKLEIERKATQAQIQRAKKIEARLVASEQALRTAEVAVRGGEEDIAQRYQEITALTQLLRTQEQLNESVGEQLQWAIAISDALMTQPRWWGMMPQSWRRERERRLLERKGLFDGAAYLQRYPDVAAEGMDPLRHYLLHGVSEGRTR